MLHRPSNVDKAETLQRMLAAIEAVTQGLPVLFPVHPRTAKTLTDLVDLPQAIKLVEPQPYLEFAETLAATDCVLLAKVLCRRPLEPDALEALKVAVTDNLRFRELPTELLYRLYRQAEKAMKELPEKTPPGWRTLYHLFRPSVGECGRPGRCPRQAPEGCRPPYRIAADDDLMLRMLTRLKALWPEVC